jgi:hypothetical protein
MEAVAPIEIEAGAGERAAHSSTVGSERGGGSAAGSSVDPAHPVDRDLFDEKLVFDRILVFERGCIGDLSGIRRPQRVDHRQPSMHVAVTGPLPGRAAAEYIDGGLLLILTN